MSPAVPVRAGKWSPGAAEEQDPTLCPGGGVGTDGQGHRLPSEAGEVWEGLPFSNEVVQDDLASESNNSEDTDSPTENSIHVRRP